MRASRWFLLAALLLPMPARADIVTGLIGWWPFTGDARDASGNGNDGTPNATAQLTADRFGMPNRAFHFNGLDSRIDIPSSPSLESPTTALTMAAWIRRDGWGMVGTLYNPILTKSISTPNVFQYRFITTQTGMQTALNNWNLGVAAPFSFDADRWYHVASSWDGDTVRSYVDGVQVGAGPLATTILPDANVLSIGSDVPGVLEIFYGDIDEVRLYARALGPADIAELAGLTTAVPHPDAGAGPLRLAPARPNPFRRTTTIEFTVSAATTASIEILDPAGRLIRRLMTSEPVSAGAHRVVWDGRDATGRDAGQGLLFYRVRTPQAVGLGRVVHID